VSGAAPRWIAVAAVINPDWTPPSRNRNDDDDDGVTLVAPGLSIASLFQSMAIPSTAAVVIMWCYMALHRVPAAVSDAHLTPC